MNIETSLIHAGQIPDPTTGARAAPIYLSSCYTFADTDAAARIFALEIPGYIYTRLNNPTNDVAEQRLAALEGGSGALVTASGMSAIFLAIETLAAAGDHIVASSSLYGGTDTLFRFTLKKFGIDVSFVDPDATSIAAAIRPNTKAVYCETIGNPKCDVPDLDAISRAAHAAGVPLVVDNTFAPVLCRPFDHGADIVVHSTSKWIGGHGTAIGGVLIDGGRFDWRNPRFPDFNTPDESYHGVVYANAFQNVPGAGNIAFITKARVQGMRNIGLCASPFNSFIILQGLETLALRIAKHCENALALAAWLQRHPAVAWVNYAGLPGHPQHDVAKRMLKGGFGGVLGFGLKGGKAAGENFINRVKLASHVANVGDAKTLVIHPASTTHGQLTPDQLLACGITPEFVRVSVGLENLADIQADFDQAMR